MKKTVFTFFLSFLLLAFLGVGSTFAAECPQGYTKGESPLESMTIPCGPTQIKEESNITLSADSTYVFEASGLCNWRVPGSTNGYLADAEYWLRNDQYGEGWTKQKLGSIVSWDGTGATDFDWGEYNEEHLYSIQYTPALDGKLTLYFNDNIYTDNSGSLQVDIYQCNPPERYAEITGPTENATVSGDVTFTAFLVDDDQDPVQWAIRKGTCAMGTGTVFGNVDGKHDVATLTHDGVFTTDFSFTTNVDSLEEGMYCFVYNPTEDAGEADIRLTREFYIETDADNDGVLDIYDLCANTVSDQTARLGTNRWRYLENYKGHTGWFTLLPNKKKHCGYTYMYGQNTKYTMEDTHGCSCKQILDHITALVGRKGHGMVGHYGFGCSKSVIDAFIEDTKDGDIDGYNKLNPFDQNRVLPNGSKTVSRYLSFGRKYLLKAYGTFTYNPNLDWADAEWYLKDGVPVKDIGSTPYVLDISINGFGKNIDWGDYNSDHIYYHTYRGRGAPIAFSIYDSHYGDNQGHLNVDIFKFLY